MLGRVLFRLDILLSWGQFGEKVMASLSTSEKTDGCLNWRVLELFLHLQFYHQILEFVTLLIMSPCLKIRILLSMSSCFMKLNLSKVSH